jgi:hypothetical protein
VDILSLACSIWERILQRINLLHLGLMALGCIPCGCSNQSSESAREKSAPRHGVGNDSGTNSEPSKADQHAKKDTAAREPPVPIKEANGYVHEESAVGFLYPAGWKNLGTSILARNVSTLGLRHSESHAYVTLYWSPIDDAIIQGNIGNTEYASLKPLYQDSLEAPVEINVRGRTGYKIVIHSGPVGTDTSNLSGVAYVFAVRADRSAWKIKLRATVSDVEHLSHVEALLSNYRFDAVSGPN